MQAIVAFGFGAFFVSSLAIGLRLVWLARRNRGLPELLIGLGILGIGPAGFALMVLAMLFGEGRPGVAFACLATAQLAIAGGALAAYVFNWTVFRPRRGLGARGGLDRRGALRGGLPRASRDRQLLAADAARLLDTPQLVQHDRVSPVGLLRVAALLRRHAPARAPRPRRPGAHQPLPAVGSRHRLGRRRLAGRDRRHDRDRHGDAGARRPHAQQLAVRARVRRADVDRVPAAGRLSALDRGPGAKRSARRPRRPARGAL